MLDFNPQYHYESDKQCRKCKGYIRYKNKENRCVTCARGKYKKHYDSNSEEIIKKTRVYQDNNRDETKERSANYYSRNKEKISNRKKKRRNTDEGRARNQKYRDENPEIIKAQRHRRKARQANSEGSFTASEWKQLLKDTGKKCLRCRKKFGILRKPTADHVKPISKGGSSYITNIQPLCFSCNSSKGAKEIDYR